MQALNSTNLYTKDMLWTMFLALVLLALTLSSANATATNTTDDDVRRLARLYSAAFDREPKTDGLNFWVDRYEGGTTPKAIARQFYESPEFTKRYGTLTNSQYVEQLYRNVLGREGQPGGIDFWIGRLASGAARAEILLAFADSQENIVKTEEAFANMRIENGEWVFNDTVPPQPQPQPQPQYCPSYSNPQIYPNNVAPFICGSAGHKTNVIMSDINQFWGSSMYACSCSYDQPQCADNAVVWGNNPFDPGFGYIYYDSNFMANLENSSGTILAPAMVFGHEAGHVIQAAYSKTYPVQSFKELSADCLSGFYLGGLSCTGVGTSDDYLGALRTACEIGGASSYFDPHGHGSCSERMGAVIHGMESYQRGIAPFDACM